MLAAPYPHGADPGKKYESCLLYRIEKIDVFARESGANQGWIGGRSDPISIMISLWWIRDLSGHLRGYAARAVAGRVFFRKVAGGTDGHKMWCRYGMQPFDIRER
ncbi:hypothetical protein MICA_2359 [Micavibrio aeruginosavorus ARL-13]|uniref:Uncharacterized protein n=1 Tax=Micavibrio aeruginosavorus (strain ARL-13) TaxID=856793 RepID=G2KMG8_MICAA|nr:hypothetical protein MICA_2359 [Micavibrio aeruginosavorus ARL-13]